MSLLTDYQAAYSSEIRVNASNPQNSSATTVDTTRETLAANAAQATFEAICGVAYDGSNNTHVAAAVPLVYYRLLLITGQTSFEMYNSFLEHVREIYRPVLGRNRITPTTNSELDPTAEPAQSKPMSDLSAYTRLTGHGPGTDSATDDPARSPGGI